MINTHMDGIELKGRETLCAPIVASSRTLFNISFFALAHARNCTKFVNWLTPQ
jgi:hypothetical protein